MHDDSKRIERYSRGMQNDKDNNPKCQFRTVALTEKYLQLFVVFLSVKVVGDHK